jgi:flagellar biosynthetic protein FlhB
MSEEDSSQKTEEPTQKRLTEAHKKGQTFLSREVMSWLVLFLGALIVVELSPTLLKRMVIPLRHLIESAVFITTESAEFVSLGDNLFMLFATSIILPLCGLVVCILLAGFIQTKGVFSVQALAPDLSRLSPLKGLKRLFSKKSFIEFLKSLFKVIFLGTVVYFLLKPAFQDALALFFSNPYSTIFSIRDLASRLLVGFLSVLAGFALLDFAYQRYVHMQEMRMSKQEIKDEYKDTEGDPIIKARLKKLRQDRARKRMMAAVPQATVILTNPTHYSIALKYDMESMDAPLVVAKGVDFLALRIREVAQEHEIPIVENPPLARGLYESVEVDESIPPKFYEAVAEVIRYVLMSSGKKFS